MLKKIIALTLALMALSIPAYASEDNIPSETTTLVGNYCYYVDTDDLNFISRQIDICRDQMYYANNLAKNARSLGYPEDHPIIALAQMEWECANSSYWKYTEKLELWQTRMKEYPTASQIWLYLRNCGYSKEICAGILGNIMAEVGGNTFDIQCGIYNSTKLFYGICQWNIVFYPKVKGETLQGQCDFLRDSIESEINTFGYKYKKNFKYADFIILTDYEEAALAFAKAYERCASQHYEVRKTNAEAAYKYFAG